MAHPQADEEGWAFDRDIRARPIGKGRWRADIADRWNVADVPNGGFVMALVLSTVGAALPHPDPLTATCHYLAPSSNGEADIRVEVTKTGRRLSTASASLVQAGRERVRMLATYTDLATLDGPTRVDGHPPDLGPDSELVPGLAGTPLHRLARQLDSRVPRRMVGRAAGHPTGEARLVGRARFSDGRPPDLVSLPLFADSFPPAVFQLGHEGWTPTIELTLHFRARPAPGWLDCAIRTRFLQAGVLEEDVELWDAEGALVGLSRQLALVTGAHRGSGRGD